MITTGKKPKITVMGEEVDWDDLPDSRIVNLDDLFKPVRISEKAFNSASKIVPKELWEKNGLHLWLQPRIDQVFSKLSSDERRGQVGRLKCFFDFDSNGPVLTDVSL